MRTRHEDDPEHIGAIGVYTLPQNYEEAWQRQEEAVEALLAARARGDDGAIGSLFLGEHAHVYTMGQHAEASNLLVPQRLLEQQGIPLAYTNRGGDITYHGPGQLVGYPLLYLPAFRLGARAYIARLEETVIEALCAYGLEGHVDPKAAGVWLQASGGKPLRKICAMGVHISRSVSMHGFAVNVNTDLSYFTRINPCGFTDRGVSSIALEVGHAVDFEQFRTHFLTVFARHFHVGITPRSWSRERAEHE